MIAPPDIEVSEGNTVLLTCVARGAPSPEVFWTFNGVIVSNYTNETSVYSEDLYISGERFVSSVLEICSVDETDMGEYTCVARQGERNVSVTFDLDVVDIGKRYCSRCTIVASTIYMYVCMCNYLYNVNCEYSSCGLHNTIFGGAHEYT